MKHRLAYVALLLFGVACGCAKKQGKTFDDVILERGEPAFTAISFEVKGPEMWFTGLETAPLNFEVRNSRRKCVIYCDGATRDFLSKCHQAHSVKPDREMEWQVSKIHPLVVNVIVLKFTDDCFVREKVVVNQYRKVVFVP